jgi:hypothetical protein
MLRSRILVPLLAVCALMLGQFAFISLARAAPPEPVATQAAQVAADCALVAFAADTSPTLATVADPPSGRVPPLVLVRWGERSKFDAPRGGDEDDDPEAARADPPDPPPLPA